MTLVAESVAAASWGKLLRLRRAHAKRGTYRTIKCFDLAQGRTDLKEKRCVERRFHTLVTSLLVLRTVAPVLNELAAHGSQQEPINSEQEPSSSEQESISSERELEIEPHRSHVKPKSPKSRSGSKWLFQLLARPPPPPPPPPWSISGDGARAGAGAQKRRGRRRQRTRKRPS